MTRNGNTWTFNDYLDCGDSVSATFTCNPDVDVSDCVNKWSASISIPCIQNLVITGQSIPCGCDEAPVFGLSGDTSECSCCNCPDDDFSIVCSVCKPCAQRDEETGPPPPGVSTVCEQCINAYGHACWTDEENVYQCYNDCVQANCSEYCYREIYFFTAEDDGTLFLEGPEYRCDPGCVNCDDGAGPPPSDLSGYESQEWIAVAECRNSPNCDPNE
jgi:hypothetical protein